MKRFYLLIAVLALIFAGFYYFDSNVDLTGNIIGVNPVEEVLVATPEEEYSPAEETVIITPIEEPVNETVNANYSAPIENSTLTPAVDNLQSQELNIQDNTITKLSFVSPTPNNGAIVTNTTVQINVSIVEPTLSSLIYNWNGTNYTYYNDSLVLMYNFDNVSGLGDNSSTVIDLSKYGNNGTLINGATWNSSGKYNGALSLDGFNDYVDVGSSNSLDITSQITLAAWINTANINQAWQAIVGKQTGGGGYYTLILESTTQKPALWLNVGGWANRAISPEVLSQNIWYYIVGTYNGTAANLYVNGILKNSSALSGSISSSAATPVYVGMNNNVYFNGSIDEVRIWDRSLSAAEIYQQYASNLNKFNSSQWYLDVNQSKNATTGLTDGTYTYQTFATDSSNNQNATEQRTITIGNSGPTINILSPTNGAIYSTNSVDLNWTVNESISWCAYSLDGAANDTSITSSSGQTVFNATGIVQTFTVPAGVTSLNVKVWGAGGGSGWYSSDAYSWAGGAGGFSNGTIAVTPGETLKIVVGVGGKNTSSYNGNGIGGYLGGGNGTMGDASGAGGGGLSGIFTDDVTIEKAIIIAGGGGGSTGYYPGGQGGGLIGGSCRVGEHPLRASDNCGAGGNQTSGGKLVSSGADGSALQGGNGDLTGSPTSGTADGGGGGGGYYGGEGGMSDARGGGGGSGYLNATRVTGGNTYLAANSSNSSAYPIGINDSDYIAGVGIGSWKNNGGNGSIVIEYTAASGSSITNKTLTSLSEGNHSVIIYCNDTSSNWGQSSLVNFIINITYPLFSNYWDSSATLSNSGTGLFNVTIANSNGTVLLEVNNTNISATSNSNNVFNASYYFATAGTYTYRWHAWGNGTTQNYNSSSLRSYTVNSVDNSTTQISLLRVYPTTNINATQHQWFNVTVNVSCLSGTCGEINVTLDPTTGTNYTFTTCGASGRSGPSQTQCNTNYTGTTLAGLVTIGGNGTQNWTVPYTGTYTIEAYGAEGGRFTAGRGGYGAYIKGNFDLTAGEVVQILVGQAGGNGVSGNSGTGGGGGTFVVKSGSPLVVAGGGGGYAGCADQTGNAIGLNGTTSTSGLAGNGGGGAGGTDGSGGGAVTNSYPGAGGGGFSGNGTYGTRTTGTCSISLTGYSGLDGTASRTAGGLSFNSGGVGGRACYVLSATGGFGGGGGEGGCGGGGAGGYSGGGGGQTDAYGGGGGGSYNSGTNQINLSGNNTGSGRVIITYLSSTSAKSGTVSMNSSVTPFYTNTTNPYTLTLNQGESQLITWYVNATGTINNNYEFFVYANLTNNSSISNQTSKWNITILDLTIPTISIVYPTATTYDTSLTALNYTYYDYNPGYCWYSTNNGATNSSAYNAGTNFTGLSSAGGENTWTVYCNDSSGNLNSAAVTFMSNIPFINLSLIYPLNNINATQHQFFNVTVNISCLVNNCGEINVTLDPAAATSYNFTNCGATGASGPSQTNCNTNYSGTNLDGMVNVSGGIQNWTVPTTGTYTIEVWGAQGGYLGAVAGGLGARMKGTFQLTQGTVLQILVGQMGGLDSGSYGGGGGGGSFVANGINYSIANATIVAGGGGGAGAVTPNNANASTNTSGRNGGNTNGGIGGTDGTGGSGGSYGGCGGGFLTSGTGGESSSRGFGFRQGGAGKAGAAGGIGGFGGGGGGYGGAGGGGGYSGGGGGGWSNGGWGGGGGSYNNGTEQNNSVGNRTGAGLVIITYTGTSSLKSGTVSMNSSATPFYTNTTNPYNLTLNVNQSAIIVWYVNATGTIDNPYEFHVDANKTSDQTTNDATGVWNVTIKDLTAPIISISYPTNSTYTYNFEQLNYSYADVNSVSMCWYSIDAGATNSTKITTATNFINLSTSLRSNTWTVYCNDSSNNLGSENVTFTVNIPRINVDLVNSNLNISATKDQFFTVAINVSCLEYDCGNITISLDPESADKVVEQELSITTTNSESARTELETIAEIVNQADDSDKQENDQREGLTIQSAITLYDNQSFTYDIVDGCSISDGQTDVLDGGLVLYINTSSLYSGTRSSTEDSGREAVCDGQTISSLNISRKVYVPQTGNWSRYLEILHNPSAQTNCVNVRIYQNMGSDGGDFLNTSDGNLSWELSDYWLQWDDTSTSIGSDEPCAFIYQHNSATEKIDALIPVTAGGGYNEWSWNNVCVAPGQTKILMHFFTQRLYRDWARAEANAIYLGATSAPYTTGMSATELSQVVNWVTVSLKGGLISQIAGTTPFYTNTSNPYNVSLNVGETATITWYVNASGSANSTYEFYAYANLSADPTNSNSSFKWNVTIVDTTDDNNPPTVTLATPLNGTSSSSNSRNFAANFTENFNITNATFYLWNSTGTIINQTAWYLSGRNNQSNLTVTLSYNNAYLWNYYACDNASLCAWATTNFTYIYDTVPPYYTGIANISIINNESLYEDINASDNIQLGQFAIDWTTNFTINSQTGILQNSTIYAAGTYYVNVTVNDTANNLNMTRISVTVTASNADKKAPNVNYSAPTPATGYVTTNSSLTINTSISEDNDLWFVNYFWNGTNYTMYNSSLALMLNFNNVTALGENSSYMVDTSRNWYNGTIYGDAFINLSGKNGGALQLDGNGDYVDCQAGTNLDLTSSITLSAWINTKNIGQNWQAIVGKQTGATGYYSLIMQGDTQKPALWLNVGSWSSKALSTEALSENIWYHIVGTYNGSAARIYVNGVLKNSSALSGSISSSSTTPVYVGMNNNSYFNGQMDEVRIWNYALTAAEVYQQYAGSLQKFNRTQWYLYVNQSQNATNGLGGGTYAYQIYAADMNRNYNATAQRTVVINISTATDYPIFSNLWDNNATQVDSGTGLFNVSITHTNGTVIFEINNTNITATNYSATVFNASYYFVTNGTYTYKWHAWSNSTSRTYNSTSRSYRVNVSDYQYPVFSNPLNNNGTISTSGTGTFNITIINTNGTVILEINNTNITATNYSATIFNASYYFASNGTYTYQWHAWGNGPLKRYNGSGSRTFTLNYTDYNYPTFSNYWDNNASLIGTGAALFNVTISHTNGTVRLTVNGTNYTAVNHSRYVFNVTISGLSNESYSYYWSAYGNGSYRNYNSSTIRSYQINTTDTVLPTVTIRYPVNNVNYSYNVVQLNYTASDNIELSRCWYSNNSGSWNSTKNNPGVNFTSMASQESWNTWTVYCNDTTNNINSNTVTFYKDTVVPTFSNATNLTVEYDTNFGYDFEATDTSGISCFTVNDTTNFNINCSGYLKNNTKLSVARYGLNLTANDTFGNRNYLTFWVNVSDTTKPTFVTVVDQQVEYSYPLAYDVDATDASGISCFTVNDTTNFKINCSGYLQNNTKLSIGQYGFNITVNDTYNNRNQTTIHVTVNDTIAPTFGINHNQTVEYDTNLGTNLNASDASSLSCYYINDTTNFRVNCSGYLSNNTKLSVTRYGLNVTANDTLNNKNFTTLYVNVTDTKLPTVTLRSPANSYVNQTTARATVLFNCSATDNYALTNISLYLTNRLNHSFVLNQTATVNGVTNSSSWTLMLLTGNYTWGCQARDYSGNLNWSSTNRTLSLNFTDYDFDEVPDWEDLLEGNESYVNITGILDLNITIDGNSTRGTYNETRMITFYNGTRKIANFTHNFSAAELNLGRIRIVKEADAIIINLSNQLLPEYNKTVYLINNNYIGLCVKDAEISSSAEISADCNQANETSLNSCLSGNYSVNGIQCQLENDTFTVSNLRYSGLKGIPASSSSSSSSTSGGGGGGSGGSAGGGEGIITAIIEPECDSNSDCASDETCHDGQCVKIFDIKIIDIVTPISEQELGFTYFVKGMANVNDDVVIKFWLEKDSTMISSGQDTIYLSEFEEKTETAKIFVPSEIQTGDYDFYVQVGYGDYQALAHRTIYLEQTATGLKANLVGGAIGSRGLGALSNYWLIVLIVFVVVILLIISWNYRETLRYRLALSLQSLTRSRPSAPAAPTTVKIERKISLPEKKNQEFVRIRSHYSLKNIFRALIIGLGTMAVFVVKIVKLTVEKISGIIKQFFRLFKSKPRTTVPFSKPAPVRIVEVPTETPLPIVLERNEQKVKNSDLEKFFRTPTEPKRPLTRTEQLQRELAKIDQKLDRTEQQLEGQQRQTAFQPTVIAITTEQKENLKSRQRISKQLEQELAAERSRAEKLQKELGRLDRELDFYDKKVQENEQKRKAALQEQIQKELKPLKIVAPTMRLTPRQQEQQELREKRQRQWERELEGISKKINLYEQKTQENELKKEQRLVQRQELVKELQPLESITKVAKSKHWEEQQEERKRREEKWQRELARINQRLKEEELVKRSGIKPKVITAQNVSPTVTRTPHGYNKLEQAREEERKRTEKLQQELLKVRKRLEKKE